jgi:GAF domain-containing protein
MRCPPCQHENRPQAKFCEECGSPFKGASPIAPSYADPTSEVERLKRALTEALEQQTATGEILRVISGSPTDIQPVFDTIVDSALRLCDGLYSGVYRLDGDVIQLVAHNDLSPEAEAVLRREYPRPPSREGFVARAILERRVIHVSDVETDPEASEWSRSRARLLGYRSFLVVPMLREGRPIGAIRVNRGEPRPFAEKQIALLRVFADQAVIAIENVRLFQELRARNRELTQVLDRERATGEVLRVISASPTTVEPVFETILASAMRLCDAPVGLLFLYENETFRLVAHRGAPATFTERFPRGRASPGVGIARAVAERRPIQVLDTLADPAYAEGTSARLATVDLLGARTVVWVPMLREGEPVGVICTWRHEVRAFTDVQVDLLATFAAQAVIAIENVRLFTELQEKNRALTEAHAQVTEALEQQTATADILRVISSSPTDLGPVMTAVAANAARLCEAEDAHIYRVEGDLLRLTASHGPRPTVEEVPIENSVVIGRVVLERETVHVHDLAVEVQTGFPDAAAYQQRFGTRTILASDPPAARRGADRGHRASACGGAPVRAQTDHAPSDVCRPSRHRDRERAPVHGARGAEPGADRDPRTADGDRRDPARHLQLAD